MAEQEKKDAAEEKPAARRSKGATTYDNVSQYLATLQAEGGHTWPIDDARLLSYIGPQAWAAVVNYERAEKDEAPLPEAEAVLVRPKLFNKKNLDRD